jgi:hypothetical protein
MAASGWLVPAISWKLIGLIWVYNLVWLIVVDLVKVALFQHFDTHESKQSAWQRWFHTPLDAYRGRLGKLAKT